MSIIAVSNQKGGVGKTTTTLNLGAALQALGKRVLLVDLDPQGSLTVAAGLNDGGTLHPTIGDVLASLAHGRRAVAMNIESAVVSAPCGLDIVPANATLASAELAMVSALNRESLLAQALRPVVGQYDFILIDCLPSLGLTAVNALRAADGLLIPVQADFLAVQGLAHMFETVAAVREQLNPGLTIYGVALTLVDNRTAHAREIMQMVRASLAGEVPVFQTEVRLHVVLKQAATVGQSVLTFAPDSPGAESYRQLAREVLAATGELHALAAAALPIGPPVTRATADLLPIDGAKDAPPVGEAVAVAALPAAKSTSVPRFSEFLAGRDAWLGRQN